MTACCRNLIDAPASHPGREARLFALFPNVGLLRYRIAARMSGGKQQMLSVARTLVGNPRLLLLDEPTAGLSPLIAGQMVAAVLSLKAVGVTVLLAEQNPRFATRVADRAVVLEKGRAAWVGNFPELQADAGAWVQYLAVQLDLTVYARQLAVQYKS